MICHGFSERLCFHFVIFQIQKVVIVLDIVDMDDR